MFCPKCGAGEQHADAYCKRCGEWLPEHVGIARRALWGEGIAPEKKLKSVLVRQTLSALLALASAIVLFMTGANLDNASSRLKVVALLCLLVAGMQLDGFFLTLRIYRNLRHNRVDADRSANSSTAPTILTETADERLNGKAKGAEDTTRKLEPLALERKRIE